VAGDPAIESVFAGHRIEAVVGRGGMGVLYRAEEESSRRTVALKLIAPELAADEAFRRRFEREARLAAALDHPHIVPVYRAGEFEGRLFLTMRLVEGTDLEALIATHGRLHPRYAAAIVAQLAAALDAAHSNDLIHRDVKPGNVLLEDRGGRPHAFLTDFGLSKLTSSTSGLTKTGRWVGTVDYAAPEQVRAEQTDGRTDVYALACVLFESLSGQVPFPRTSEVAKIAAHLTEAPPSITEVVPGWRDDPSGEGLDELLGRALAKDPRERHQSAGQLAEAAVAAAERFSPPDQELLLAPDAERPPVDRGAPTAG
jgi:serine/threonine protein kinase